MDISDLEAAIDRLPRVAADVPDVLARLDHSFDLLADAAGDRVAVEQIGASEEGRPIFGIVAGSGPTRVSLIAGNHADEPVGPRTLLCLARYLADDDASAEPLLDVFTLVIIPHTNPDGEARNRSWMDAWPDAAMFARKVVREQPGRDVEFGFPDLRRENRAASGFLAARGPYDLHLSLHGMAFAEGAMLLVDRMWAPHTAALQRQYVERAIHVGVGLHDQNRRGEKGFFYLGPGLWTTPEGSAMRVHFELTGDHEMASRFRDSSMEFVQSLGRRPLCLVTEVPLFRISRASHDEPGLTSAYVALRERLAEWRLAGSEQNRFENLSRVFGVRHVPVGTAMDLQLTALRLGLRHAAQLRN